MMVPTPTISGVKQRGRSVTQREIKASKIGMASLACAERITTRKPRVHEPRSEDIGATIPSSLIRVAEKLSPEAVVALGSIALVLHYGVTSGWVMLFVLATLWSLFAFRFLREGGTLARATSRSRTMSRPF